MQAAAKTNLFFISSSSSGEFTDLKNIVSQGGSFYHIVVSLLARAVCSRQEIIQLAEILTGLAQHHYSLRNWDALEELSRTLINLPIETARQIGLYYYALAINRKGRRAEANALLENIADKAPLSYRARAIQTLGANYHAEGQIDEALRFHIEALKAASAKNGSDLLTTLLAHLDISAIKSANGNHKEALADLEKLSPLVQIISKRHPLYFYVYHNELAVELGELGRIEEAKAACDIALATPFAPAYPEWSATDQELEAKRTSATSSVVAISRTPEADNSLKLEVEPHRNLKPSRVLNTCWLASEAKYFQTAINTTPEFQTIVDYQSLRTTLNRVGKCIKTRAPPPHS